LACLARDSAIDKKVVNCLCDVFRALQERRIYIAKERSEQTIEKYTKLYDYAPSGYFTLSQDGKVTEANLTGAHMLGKMRSSILNSQFGFHF
jgi:hypothetical protein